MSHPRAPDPAPTRPPPAGTPDGPPDGPVALRHRVQDGLAGAILGPLLRLPYRHRLAAMGWLMRAVIGPLGRAGRRIDANLAHVWPDLPPARRRRIAADCLDNLGRAVIEVFSGRDFADRAARLELTGPGLAALESARAAGRPAVLVTAHFGNYDAMRAALLARGFPVGGFYRPTSNPLFNRRYVAAIRRIGEPLFPAGRAGMADMVRFLRGGGMLALVSDHHIGTGVALDFLGRPALTALSAAELALRYDAALIPLYAVRQPDGISFLNVIEAPIPPSDPVTMTQALNDSASAMIRAHPGQWFWLHRRWKGA